MPDRTLEQIAKETCEWELTCQIDWHYSTTHAIIEDVTKGDRTNDKD